MNAKEFLDNLTGLMFEEVSTIHEIVPFGKAGVLSDDNGVVVELQDGSKYTIIVKQIKKARKTKSQ